MAPASPLYPVASTSARLSRAKSCARTTRCSGVEMDARRLRRAVGDSRWRTPLRMSRSASLGRWRLAARAEAEGKHAPVHPFGCHEACRSVLVGPASFADRDLVFQDFSL